MRTLGLVLLFLLLSCDSITKDLPILSYKIDGSGNRINYTIHYEEFTNHLGNPFTTETINDKVFIANFFFTRCPSICPPMRMQLITIAETFKAVDDFMIVSHTIDPEYDSVDVLKNYAEATGINNDKWQFVRSSEAHTKLQAKQFMTNFKPNEDGTDFYHSSYMALVDKQQHIRGFYNILVMEDVKRLQEDIQSLIN